MRVLITGAAGFIGMHTAKKFLNNGFVVSGIDNLNDYYDSSLKEDRLMQLNDHKGFSFELLDIEDRKGLEKIFIEFQPDIVVNLAAQAGVRYSIENPSSYVNSNLVGFGNILECCRENKIKHLVYASSSSVYGLNSEMPFDEGQNVDHPVALYGATKKSNELLAHSYSHLFNLPTTGLRFFTVYGPWGRPDMALFKFTKAILNNEAIDVFNHGKMMRDFTFVDDIVEGIFGTANKIPEANKELAHHYIDAGNSPAPWRIFNIGRGKPVPLMEFIIALERQIGKKAYLNFCDMQPGDVKETYADTTRLEEWIGWKPQTEINDGIKSFVEWYREYYSETNI